MRFVARKLPAAQQSSKIVATTQSQARAMADQQPTVQLQALIQALQAQVQALQNAAPAVQAAPAAAATPVVFADMPQTLGVDDLLNYLTKRGQLIYEQGCKALDNKALTNGFNLIPNKTVVFVEAFQRHADAMGWTKGPSRSRPSQTVVKKPLTSSRIVAKLTRPCSKLHVSNSARQEKLIPNLVPSKTTQ